MPGRDSSLEAFVYEQLDTHRESVFHWAEVFNLDPLLVASILIVERQQYHLPDARRAVHRAGHACLDLVQMVGKLLPSDTTRRAWEGLILWVNCSRGFCRINFDTAAEAWARHRSRVNPPILSEMDICRHDQYPDLSVAVSCRSEELARQWEPFVPTVRYLPRIMATLYNVSNFENKRPHPFPAVGGSVMDVIVDGRHVEGEVFGNRVFLVVQSDNMKQWGAKKWRS